MKPDASGWKHHGLAVVLALQAALATDLVLEEAEVVDGTAEPRRLVDIGAFEGWGFPAGTALSLQSLLPSGAFGSGAAATIELTALAGYQYQALQISVPNLYQFDVQHSAAEVRLVLPGASPANCYLPAFAVPTAYDWAGESSQDIAPGPLVSGSGMRVVLDSPPSSLTASTEWPHFIFMKGGEFEICYSPDGSFVGSTENAMVPAALRVIGVTSPCTTDDCMMSEFWDCYFTHRGELQGPCRFDFDILNGREGWGVTFTGTSRMWWSAEWDADTFDLDGAFVPASARRCSKSRTGDSILPEAERFADEESESLQLAPLRPAILPSLQENTSTSSFTLTACYCPNFESNWDVDDNPCSTASEFIQPIGVLRYWLLRICDPATYAGCGVLGPPYMRAVPQHPFVIRLECPPGGFCNGTAVNRFRIVDPLPAGIAERPTWASDHHCKFAEESHDATWVPLPPEDEFTEFADNFGGLRRDYKYQRVSVNVSVMGGMLDVCYCDLDCNNRENYFKVGSIQTVRSFGIARWTREPDPGATEVVESMRYAGKSGSITLFSGLTSPVNEAVHAHDGAPFTAPAVVKVFPYDRGELFSASPSAAPTTFEKLHNLDRADNPDLMEELGAACASMPFSGQVIEGLTSQEEARTYLGWVDPNSEGSQRLPFTGVGNDQFMRPLQAGILVVCYCSKLNANNDCEENRYWLPATKIMIRGPAGTTSTQLPTNVNVRLDIEGWGFSEGDVLRLIGVEQSCTENANQPRGAAGFKLGCPGIDGQSCRLPSQFEDIPTVILSSATTGIYITSIEIGDFNSTLVFSDAITDVFLDGDAISINTNSILFEGRNTSELSQAQQFIVARFSGQYPFMDDTTDTHLLWLKVHHVPNQGVLSANRLSVNVGWSAGLRPVISFRGGRGEWVRHNRLRTNEDIRAFEEADLQICFSPLEDTDRSYYASAGTVLFRHPPTMTSAGVHLTVWREYSKAPVVIHFAPTQGNSLYRDFSAPIALRLLFRDTLNNLEPLLAGEISDSLQPLPPTMEVPREEATQVWCGRLFTEMWSNDVEGFPLPKGCYFGRQYEDVPVVPGISGDVYREYFILFEQENGLKDTCVDQSTGNSVACVYMLVLNAEVKQVQQITEDLVGIYPMCVAEEGQESACGNQRYQVLEYGPGTPYHLTKALGSDAPRLQRVDLAIDGSLVGNPARQTSDVELEGERQLGFNVVNFQMRAWVQNNQLPIQRSAQLRLMLRPFTLWDLGVGACRAVCIPPDGVSCDDTRGGNESICRRDPVVMTTQDWAIQAARNVITLTYPAGMESIPQSTADAHILQVSSMRLPDWGFYPTQFIVQLADSNEENPSWVLSDRRFYIIPSGMTTGRLLVEGQAESGPRPFAGDRFNRLLARISLGASLRHTGQSTLASPTLELLLPPGYVCSVVGDGFADPDGDRETFRRDLNSDNYPDHFLRSTVRSGIWSNQDRRCLLTLDSEGVIFAGQAFYVLLSVDNPPEPLFKDDPTNVWLITATGMNGYLLGNTTSFVSLQEEESFVGWAGNMAVLATLHIASLQPSSFVAGGTNILSVFFRSVHDTPAGSHVILDAPDGFDFGSTCMVFEMDSEYLVDWRALPWGEDRSGDRSVTRSLGQPQNCTGARWQNAVFDPPPTSGFTRAKIKTSIRMLPDTFYAFRIEVHNTPFYIQQQHDEWDVWVHSPAGYPTDGTQNSLSFNMERVQTVPTNFVDRSWGVFNSGLQDTLTLEFDSMPVLPTSVMVVRAQVSVYSFLFATDTQTSVRITAPTGYEFAAQDPGGFIGTAPCPGHAGPSNPSSCAQDGTCVILSTPISPYPNELVLPDVVFRGGLPYGFCVRLNVPEMPATRSANEFFFELGYDGGNLLSRHQAGLLPAPQLRVVYDARIASLSNAAQYDLNELEFFLTTVSGMTSNQGFVFVGDEHTRGMRLACWPQMVEGTLQLPLDALCSVFEDTVTGLPVIVLSAQEEPIPAGSYGFRFVDVGNPWMPTSARASWFMGTYADVDQYPNLRVLDLAKEVPAQKVLPDIAQAGLLQPPAWEALGLGYDSRPSELNRLIFYFRLHQRPLAGQSEVSFRLALRGPKGFEFQEDCLGALTTLDRSFLSRQGMSGDTWPCSAVNLSSQSWCPMYNETFVEFMEWPQDLLPVACLGSQNTAMIETPLGVFEAQATYAFQIEVRNALSNARTNLWALDFVSESSRPFESFDVTTFNVSTSRVYLPSWSTVQPLDDGTYPSSAYHPVLIEFEPSLEVPMVGYQLTNPTYGTLTIEAPKGFIFKTVTGAFVGDIFCPESEITLEVYDRSPWDTASLLLVPGDMSCTVEATNRLLFRFTGLKPLHPNTLYSFTAPVANPSFITAAQLWRLSSLRNETGLGRILPLDQAYLTGSQIALAMATWAVLNDSGEYRGDFKVWLVSMRIGLSRNLLFGDTIIVTAPPGYNLLADSPAGSATGPCSGFGWSSVIIPLPNTSAPVCRCSYPGPQCELVFNIVERGNNAGVVHIIGTVLRFRISLINPGTSAKAVFNYWRVEHRNSVNELRATSSLRSWEVLPPLQNLSLSIVGLYQRAGAVTTVALEFTPVNWGNTLAFAIREPQGFDFINARVDLPMRVDPRTTASTLVLTDGDFLAGVVHEVVIEDVLLGVGGGQTVVDLRLFAGALMTDEVGQRLNFLRGFRLPGNLEVTSQRLHSYTVVRHYDFNETDEVLPLLRPRVETVFTNTRLARFDFFFTVSRSVAAGQQLAVRCMPQDVQSTPHTPIEVDNLRLRLELCDSPSSASAPQDFYGEPLHCAAVDSVVFQLGYTTLPDGVTRDGWAMALGNASMQSQAEILQAGRTYRLRFWVIPSSDPCFWRFRTEDGGALSTNTNDDLTSSATAVAELSLEVVAARGPPTSLLTVELTIQTDSPPTPFEQISVLPPAGFQIVAGSAGSGSDFGASRRMVRLPLETLIIGQDRLTLQYTLRVLTPGVSPTDTRWFVVTEVAVGNAYQSVGWGSAGGFPITPMVLDLTFAPLLGFTGWMAVSFSTVVSSGGTYALLKAPPGVVMRCPELPNSQPAECQAIAENGVDASRQINLTLEGGVTRGATTLFSFVVSFTTPPEDPNNPLSAIWEVYVKNTVGETVDANLNKQGLPWNTVLDVENPTLRWLDDPKAREISTAFLEVTFTLRAQGVKAVLFSLPETFRHYVIHPNQIRSLSQVFPVAVGMEWRNFDNLRWIRLLIDDGTGAVGFIPSGTYQFEFPVMLPEELPLQDEWYFSLCNNYFCENPFDEHTMVTFAIPNPSPIAKSDLGLVLTRTDASLQTSPTLAMICLVILAMLASRVAFS